MEWMNESAVVCGHYPCMTRNARYLCLTDIYQKILRSNMYDIGGTYIQDVADYWFMFKAELVADMYIIHLFFTNRQECSVNINISCLNRICLFNHNKDNNIALLSPIMKQYKFVKLKELSPHYLTTYSFSKIDVELLKHKNLYIPISFIDEDLNILKSVDKQFLDFSTLLEDPVGADFTIESEDGAKFAVHKLLLITQSDVFRAMLKEDTAESKNNYVKLIDVDKEDLKFLLEFIYSGSFKDLKDISFFNMLILADRFNLQGLKELSEHALEQQLSVENALETLAVADTCNAQNLKSSTFKFIKKHPNTIENCVFDEMGNINLVRELCKSMIA
ncbi:uncharacterized protein LOC126980136 [Leptidea sinapis]|uniref:BTB domain-containing protein n=1 Tax=Leptidea sinapis TaxID=189913 RepID=A0A5E4Q501_9NEOP|nr:uncharacterized protein LOC126980136 [Leptidea sinapis]VVC92421.1 unnamed protein product [Leptidea sinapis]